MPGRLDCPWRVRVISSWAAAYWLADAPQHCSPIPHRHTPQFHHNPREEVHSPYHPVPPHGTLAGGTGARIGGPLGRENQNSKESQASSAEPGLGLGSRCRVQVQDQISECRVQVRVLGLGKTSR